MSAGDFIDRVVEATTYLPCPAWGKDGQPGGSCQLTCRNGHPFIVHGRGEGRCPACGDFAGYRAEQHLCAAQARDAIEAVPDASVRRWDGRFPAESTPHTCPPYSAFCSCQAAPEAKEAR